MSSLIAFLLALFIFAPFLPFFAIFLAAKPFFGAEGSVKLAADCSSVFFMLSVHFLLREIWPNPFLFPAGIFLLFISGGIYVYLKWNGEIPLGKLLRKIWRFGFLVFFAAYVLLVFFGLLYKGMAYL